MIAFMLYCEELERIEGVMEKCWKDTSYQLQTIPRVHTVTAYALISHIAEIERFQNANKVTSYAGVTPVFFSSAVKGKNVQNKNQGNRELYAMLYLLLCNKYKWIWKAKHAIRSWELILNARKEEEVKA